MTCDSLSYTRVFNCHVDGVIKAGVMKISMPGYIQLWLDVNSEKSVTSRDPAWQSRSLNSPGVLIMTRQTKMCIQRGKNPVRKNPN